MIAFDAKLKAVLDRVHAQSAAQDEAMGAYFRQRFERGGPAAMKFDADMETFFADKLVALERDKAEFCYQVCRALRATRIVEAGTSHGVSTLYLAAAVRDNVGQPGRGIVIGTEHEPKKAATARHNFAAAGLSDYIDLREGDLRETLANVTGPIDFLLLDIWVDAVMPAVERVVPHLRPGGVIVADNSTQSRDGYKDYFAYIADPKNRLTTVTLPFDGGLEFTVRG